MFESSDTAAWTIAEGRTGAYPFQVRLRKLVSRSTRLKYPKRLNIFWAMRSANAEGFPTKVELRDPHVFESRLVAAVEQDECALLAAVLTGRGEREFVFHLQQSRQFIKRLSDMPQEKECYPIETHPADDPEWVYVDGLLR